jgi:hypothetical protein
LLRKNTGGAAGNISDREAVFVIFGSILCADPSGRQKRVNEGFPETSGQGGIGRREAPNAAKDTEMFL